MRFYKALLTTLVFSSIFLLSISIVAKAAPVKSAAGLDLGGNGTLLVSDPSLGAFGVGAGFQGSVFLTMWKNRPWSGKMRFETMGLREESLQKTATAYLVPGSSLKSMSQNWSALSFGVERTFVAQGQTFFWEALIGYAFGGDSTVTISQDTAGTGISALDQPSSSGFEVSRGAGIRHAFSPLITGLMSVRTLLFLGAPYSTGAVANKSFIPLPILFSVGAEYNFDIGN